MKVFLGYLAIDLNEFATKMLNFEGVSGVTFSDARLSLRSEDFPSEFEVVQGFLAHNQTPLPLGPPEGPRNGPMIESQGGAVSCKRGSPVALEARAVLAAVCVVIGCETAKGRRALLRIPTTGRAKCLPMLGSLQT